jgi:hypothetical protein
MTVRCADHVPISEIALVAAAWLEELAPKRIG